MSLTVRLKGAQGLVRQGPKGEFVVLTEPFTKFNPEFHPFVNDDFGVAMNVNAAFGGTPSQIHDGEDQTLYTASALVGVKYTFSSTDHAFQGIVTIVDYTLIDAGETVTLNGTVKTAGGTDWTAATSNAATATSLASALDAISGFSASASGAVVTVLADAGSDITQLITSGEAGELVATGQSIKTDNASEGDVMQLANTGGDITLANFTAITMRIYVDKDWFDADSIEMYGYDTDLGEEVGDRVALEDFFSFADFDEWHAVPLPLAAFNLETATTVDAFRIQIVAKDGKSPKFYMDRIQLEQSGTPVEYRAVTPINTVFHITELRIALADALAATVSNGTMLGLAYDKLLNVSALTNGITFRRVQNGETLFSVTIKQLGDFLATGSNIVNAVSDGTNTFITLLIEFPEPIILEGDDGENYLSFTISDDLSGLLQFTAAARGAVVI